MSASTPQFSPIDMIKDSWAPVAANAGPLIGGVVLATILSMAAGMIPMIGPALVQGPLQFGLYAVALSASRGKTAEFTDIFAGFQRFVPAFVAGLLISIFTIVGFICCVIPGFLVAVLYAPTYLYMIEEGLDFWPAMERSRTVVMNNFGQWLILFIVLAVFNLIGAIPCGLGLLLTIPMTLIVTTRAFEMEQAAGSRMPPSLDAGFAE